MPSRLNKVEDVWVTCFWSRSMRRSSCSSRCLRLASIFWIIFSSVSLLNLLLASITSSTCFCCSQQQERSWCHSLGQRVSRSTNGSVGHMGQRCHQMGQWVTKWVSGSPNESVGHQMSQWVTKWVCETWSHRSSNGSVGYRLDRSTNGFVDHGSDRSQSGWVDHRFARLVLDNLVFPGTHIL